MGGETVDNMDVGDEPTWTTHRDVGSVPKRRERVGAGFTACLTTHTPPLPHYRVNNKSIRRKCSIKGAE
jgi:hypothetical protein